MALTREVIVGTALRMLQRDGLEALSLRRLATELKVTAPTLYWHVSSKRELLDLVADELVRSREASQRERPAPSQPWWEWLYEYAATTFDALAETRDAPRVVAGNRPTVESLPRLDRVLGVLIREGFPPADAQQTLFVLGAYVLGSATEWQGEAARAAQPQAADKETWAAIRAGGFPNLAAALGGLSAQPPRATFEFGLQLLVDALRARYGPQGVAVTDATSG